MAKFKVGDIVRLKNSNDKDKDYFYKVVNNNVIEGENNLGKILECEFLDCILHKYFMESQMQKVTFYEMLEYIKDRNIRLTINKPNWVILNCLIDFTKGVTENISYAYDDSDDIVTFYYNISFIQNNLYMNFDNLDFEKDLKEIEIKEKINKTLDVVEGNLKDAYMRSIVYGEEITVGEFLNKCCNSYFNLINNNNDKKVGINMTSEQIANKIKDIVKQLYKKEPEDEVFVNNKKKTTVIKWADGELTKATCEKEDKYDLEKGVMVAMLKKYYTVDEINSFIEKAKESQERDLNKYRKKSNKEVKKTLVDNPGEKPTNPNIGVKIKKKKEE